MNASHISISSLLILGSVDYSLPLIFIPHFICRLQPRFSFKTQHLLCTLVLKVRGGGLLVILFVTYKL